MFNATAPKIRFPSQEKYDKIAILKRTKRRIAILSAVRQTEIYALVDDAVDTVWREAVANNEVIDDKNQSA